MKKKRNIAGFSTTIHQFHFSKPIALIKLTPLPFEFLQTISLSKTISTMAVAGKFHPIIFTFFLLSVSLFNTSLSQPRNPSPAPAPAPAPASDSCNGIFLSYTYTAGHAIPPTDPTNQAYRFESTLTVLNNGRHELKSWRAFVGFQHNELLVSASNAILADGSSLPSEVGNGTVLAGFPMSDLKSAVETAGDMTQMQVLVGLVGIQFGVGALDAPMLLNISLVNDEYSCHNATKQGLILF